MHPYGWEGKRNWNWKLYSTNAALHKCEVLNAMTVFQKQRKPKCHFVTAERNVKEKWRDMNDMPSHQQLTECSGCKNVGDERRGKHKEMNSLL